MSDMHKNCAKMCTLKFDINISSSLENNIQEMAKSQKANPYICKSCHVELQPKITCVCCNRHMQKYVCKIYNNVDYDFTNFVVSQCLQHVSNSVHEEQYICSSCDKRLKEVKKTQLYHIIPNIQMQSEEQTFKRH